MDNEAEEKHECFVFISDKLAEEITLTIGQAFELAYKRFLETSGKDLESQRRAMITQQKIKRLEQENNIYKQRLLDISHFSNIRPELDQYLKKHEIKNILEAPLSTSVSSSDSLEPVNGTTKKLLDFSSDNTNGNGNDCNKCKLCFESYNFSTTYSPSCFRKHALCRNKTGRTAFERI